MRYKEYNSNKVLETSIRLFWEKGFKGCSVQDLVTATGVNRFSLYQEFEDKNGILHRALQLYRERYCATNLSILQKNEQAELLLVEFFLSFFKEERLHPGCFFIHIGTELADTDMNIKTVVADYLEDISRSIQLMLVSHAYAVEEAEHFARHLTGLYCTSMSFCLIHSERERRQHIQNGIAVILNKENTYAASTK